MIDNHVNGIEACPVVKDYGPEAQAAAENHIAACYEYVNDDGPEPEGLAGPFCGCPTCDVRETLHAAYPHLVKQVYANLCYDLRDRTNTDRPGTSVDALFARWLMEKVEEMEDNNTS